MALDHTAYCDESELKAWMRASSISFEGEVEPAIVSASRLIDGFSGRRFYGDLSPSARTYRVFPGQQLLLIDDCFDIDDVQVGGISQDPTSYLQLPLNGVSGGLEGWPVTHLEGIWSDVVTVNGRWGWAEVPGPVKTACLMLAAETFKAGEVPFGIAGMDGMGATVRVRANPLVAARLAPYRNPVIA